MASASSWTSKRLKVALPARRGPPAQMTFRTLRMRNLYVGLWLHTARDPSSEEWDASCKAFRELRRQCRENTAALRGVMISDGGAPNTIQRAQFFQPALGGQHRTSAITNSLSNPVKRGIATAISWVNPRMRAFEPCQWWEALSHVGLTNHVEQLWSEFAKLQASLPPNQTLRSIAESMRGQASEAVLRTGSM
jgi:hypothetical protein